MSLGRFLGESYCCFLENYLLAAAILETKRHHTRQRKYILCYCIFVAL